MRPRLVSAAVIVGSFWLASTGCNGADPDPEDNVGDDAGSGGSTGGRDAGRDGGSVKVDAGQGRDSGQAADGGVADVGGSTGGGDVGTVGTDAGSVRSDAGQATDGSVADAGRLPTAKPPCLKNPNQVAMLGDSYVAAPSYIGRAIVSAAIADGALASGQSYQDLSVPGTTVNSGQIPGQLDTALARNPKLKTVITNGCGNDIIQSVVCLAPGSDQISTCRDIIDNCVAKFRAMGEKAKAAGVTDSIIFQYPDNVPIGGADILRYGVEQGKKAAAEMTTADYRVYLVDVAPLMKDHPDWYLDAVIHVDSRGAKLIGDAIYELMKDHCIAQPESSGCCQPW
jgi:hypothetical protein